MKNNFVSFLLQICIFALSLVGFGLQSADASRFQLKSDQMMITQQAEQPASDIDFSSPLSHSADCEIDPEDDFPVTQACALFRAMTNSFSSTHDPSWDSPFIDTPIKPPRA